MLSWRLWRALRYPPVSPLLGMRVATLPRQALWPSSWQFFRRGRWPKVLLVLLLLLLTWRMGIAGLFLGLFAVPGAVILAFLGLPVLLPLASIVLGSYWSADISRNIRRERAARTWDLICAAPPGTPGASHVITSRCLLRGGAFSFFQLLQHIALGLCLGALLLMAAIFVVMLLHGVPQEELLLALRTLLDIAAIVAALWLHWLQTVVLVALTGLLLAGGEGRETPWFAPLLFPAIQLGSWMLFVLQLFLLQPLTARLAPESWLAWTLMPLLYLAMFLLPREALVLALLRVAGQRLQTNELFSSRWWQNATAQTG